MWFWKSIKSNYDWVFDKENSRIYKDGEDFTPDIRKWFDIKMSKQDTAWLNEVTI